MLFKNESVVSLILTMSMAAYKIKKQPELLRSTLQCPKLIGCSQYGVLTQTFGPMERILCLPKWGKTCRALIHTLPTHVPTGVAVA